MAAESRRPWDANARPRQLASTRPLLDGSGEYDGASPEAPFDGVLQRGRCSMAAERRLGECSSVISKVLQRGRCSMAAERIRLLDGGAFADGQLQRGRCSMAAESP